MHELIHKLIDQNETPFYVFDENGFITNYSNLLNTFQRVYPNYNICYSYKTNYTPYICQIVQRLGGLAEVVSDMEYTLARKLGYKNVDIIYNGPSKGRLMYEHLDNGGIINIDSLHEAQRIVSYCKKHSDRQYNLGIRINLYLGGDFISRFGLVPGSDELKETVNLIKLTSNTSIVGLHCHISRSRSVEAWRKRALIMLNEADNIIEGIPQYISLGSGMFADMDNYLKSQFGGGGVPTYEDYCEACVVPIANHYQNSAQKPKLFTEPGTTLVARYVNFASKVLSIKHIGERWIANMDGDFYNLGEICTLKKLPIHIISRGGKARLYDHIDIMGCTCLEQDLMVKDWHGTLSESDIVVFENVGGYSIVSKPQFIKPQSAMYAILPDGKIRQVMRAETFDDIFNKFIF